MPEGNLQCNSLVKIILLYAKCTLINSSYHKQFLVGYLTFYFKPNYLSLKIRKFRKKAKIDNPELTEWILTKSSKIWVNLGKNTLPSQMQLDVGLDVNSYLLNSFSYHIGF